MMDRLTAVWGRFAGSVAARPAAWRAAAAAVLLVVLAVTVARYVNKIEEPGRNGVYTKSAVLRWRSQIDDLDRGEDIYLKHSYPNPPIMALILRPFVALPPVASGVTWLLLKAALAAVAFRWVLRLASDPGRPFPPLAAAVVAVLALHPVLGDLQHGNVNIFIAFLVFASLELVRRRWDVSAGVVLALAVACKVTPALFIPYFVWKTLLAGWRAVRDRQPPWSALWRGGGAVLLGGAAGLLLWFLVVPGLALGFERNLTLLNNWYGQMVKPFVIEGKVTSEHPNQSIPGLVFRLLTHEPSEMAYDDDGKPAPHDYSNLADIGSGGAKWVIRGCQAAFVLLVALYARAPLASARQGVWFAAECGVVVLGMLLFSERTWKHHATTTALPMAALVACWAFRPVGPRFRGFLIAALAVATALMTVPSFLPEKPQDECMVYGTHTAAFVLLLVALAAVLRRESAAGP